MNAIHKINNGRYFSPANAKSIGIPKYHEFADESEKLRI